MRLLALTIASLAVVGCLESSHRGGDGAVIATTTLKGVPTTAEPRVTGWPQTPSPVTAAGLPAPTSTTAVVPPPTTGSTTAAIVPTTRPSQVFFVLKYRGGEATYSRQKGPNSSSFTPKTVGTPKGAGERQQTLYVDPATLEESGGWGCVVTSTPTSVTCDFTETLWNCSMEWHESAFPTATINTISESWEEPSLALVAGRITITKPGPRFSSGCKTQYE